MKYFLISISILLIFSCSSNKQQERCFLGSISKKPCIKHCETYDLHIYSDGKFVYIGEENSAIKGIHEGNLSKKELLKIKQLFKDLPKKDSYIKGNNVATISIKYETLITRHEFNTSVFIDFHNFVEGLYDRIP